MLGLDSEQPANACIVGGAPEQEDYGEDWYAGAFGQDIEGRDQACKYGKHC